MIYIIEAKCENAHYFSAQTSGWSPEWNKQACLHHIKKSFIYTKISEIGPSVRTSVRIPGQPVNIFLSCKNRNALNLSENKSFFLKVHKKIIKIFKKIKESKQLETKNHKNLKKWPDFRLFMRTDGRISPKPEFIFLRYKK